MARRVRQLARKLAALKWDPISTEVYALSGLAADGQLRHHRDRKLGEIVEAVLAQPNVKWEMAGVLDGGRAVWRLALLDEPACSARSAET